jgi:ABC-type uncharacterized transport system fused permease/ATPase subunit
VDDQTRDLITRYMNYLDLNPVLERVGHRVDRDMGPDWNWTDCLSPGEQQRLCFVRLFFHHPVLAVLDESTSAVSMGMERKIYEELQRLEIGYVSCGHRQSLYEYHNRVLRVREATSPLNSADNEYSIEDIK